MDRRKLNGGPREGAGRKPKAEEEKLIERLSPLDDLAFEKLSEGIQSGEFVFLKLFMEYRFGKPRETKDVDITSAGQIIMPPIQVITSGVPLANSENEVDFT